jgi:drug/metabolite transporter (DMT)-like permease
VAILCLVICLFIFSYEGYKKDGRWEIKGVLFAIIGVSLDALGVGITRYGFEHSSLVDPVEANFYRALGAICFFMVYNYFKPIKLFSSFKPLTNKEKLMAVGASLSGTFLALWCWNAAVKWGHLASISAIGATGPFMATLFECLYYKKWPNKYILSATVFFVIGLYILFI